MLEIASQMILCLLLAALIGAIIGYILGKATCSDDSCQDNTTPGIATDDTTQVTESSSTSSATTAATAVAGAVSSTKASETITPAGSEPVLLSAPRNGEKDNLTRIKGIGPKIDQTLNDIGIYHFNQIADWNDEHIAWVDANIAFPGRVKRENWVEQAKALALGEETEFSKRVDKGDVPSSKKA